MSLPLPMKKVIHTPQAPTPVGPYNQAISAQGLLFVAGQIPLDPQSGAMVGVGDVAKQTEQVMANLGAVLQEAGVGWAQVVKTTVFLKNLEDFGAMNEIYAQHFQEHSAPARACVEVARLPKDALVEIDCIALLAT